MVTVLCPFELDRWVYTWANWLGCCTGGLLQLSLRWLRGFSLGGAPLDVTHFAFLLLVRHGSFVALQRFSAVYLVYVLGTTFGTYIPISFPGGYFHTYLSVMPSTFGAMATRNTFISSTLLFLSSRVALLTTAQLVYSFLPVWLGGVLVMMTYGNYSLWTFHHTTIVQYGRCYASLDQAPFLGIL